MTEVMNIEAPTSELIASGKLFESTAAMVTLHKKRRHIVKTKMTTKKKHKHKRSDEKQKSEAESELKKAN
jgi:hypothetical protein